MPLSNASEDMSPPITAAQIEGYVTIVHSTYKSAKDHPRYQLRARAIIAILGGSILNFLALIVAFVGGAGEAPRIVTIMVGIVYSISLCYQVFDLICSPSGSKGKDQHPTVFQRHILSIYVLAMDTLGFLGFLALLIANGIVVSDLYRTSQIFVYNSVPWMVCCAIHGYIALKTVPTVLSEFSHTQKRVYCCAECKRESKKRHGKDDDGDDEDDERILLLQGQDSSQAV